MADTTLRWRLMRETVRQKRLAETITAAAAEQLGAFAQSVAGDGTDLAGRLAGLDRGFKGAELAARTDALREDAAAALQRHEAEALRWTVEHEAFEGRAPWLRPAYNGEGFAPRPPAAIELAPEEARETRAALLAAPKATREELVLEAAAAYHAGDPEAERLLAAVWLAPRAVRRQLLSEKLQQQVLGRLTEGNGTAPMLAADAEAAGLARYIAGQFRHALGELGLLPPRDRASDVVTTASRP